MRDSVLHMLGLEAVRGEAPRDPVVVTDAVTDPADTAHRATMHTPQCARPSFRSLARSYACLLAHSLVLTQGQSLEKRHVALLLSYVSTEVLELVRLPATILLLPTIHKAIHRTPRA